MAGLKDISPFNLCLILDFLKADCERRNKNETLDAIKYADIFNFAATCWELRRIVKFWSKTLYKDLDIDRLQEVPLSHVTLNFDEMQKLLKGAPAKRVDEHLDIYLRALFKSPLLKTFELRHNSQSSFSDGVQYMFDEIVMAIGGQSKRICLDKASLPKFKNIIVNIGDRLISNLSGLANTRVVKLSLTASFAISDLKEFCARNPALVTLEINAYSFSDLGKLNEIVGHCPNLKQLKFMISDIARDTEYVKLALLEKLQHLEIGKQPYPVIDFVLDEDHVMKDIESKPAQSNCVHDADSTLENSLPLLLLIKALSEANKSKLLQLRLLFKVNDDVVQAIVQLKGLRMLECGFSDTKSIEHLKEHPTLKQLIIRNRDHIITDDIADLLGKHVTVSNSFTKMNLTPEGRLYIESHDPVLFRYVRLRPLLRLKSLKHLCLSGGLVVEMVRDLHVFLELGVEIKGACEIILQPETRDLFMCYNSPHLTKEIALPLVRDLRSFRIIYHLAEELLTIRLFGNLVNHHKNTLQEICIENADLNDIFVYALTFLSSLRIVSCEVQKLEFIQRLAQLKDLEELNVLSQHNPEDVHLPLVPLLSNCRKLRSFKIKVTSSGINQAFVNCLQSVVMENKDADMQEDLDICLWITKPITPEQKTLIGGPFKLMTLRTQYIQPDDDF